MPLNEDTICFLCFADDQVIISQDCENMEYMTRNLLEQITDGVYSQTWKRTEVGRQQGDLDLNNGQNIKWCTENKWLKKERSRRSNQRQKYARKNSGIEYSGIKITIEKTRQDI